MAAFPSAAAQVQPPSDSLRELGTLISLKGMLNQQQFQQQQAAREQQLFPGQQQLQQQQIQGQQLANAGATTANQEAALRFASLQGQRQALLDANGSADQYEKNLSDPKYGVLPADQFAFQQLKNQLRTNIANADKAELDAAQQAHSQIAELANGVLSAPASQFGDKYSAMVQKITGDPTLAKYAGQLPQQTDPRQLATYAAGLETIGDFVNSERQRLEAPGQAATSQRAVQQADIVQQLSTPEALSSPGAVAAIQAKLADPATSEADKPRLQALIPKAQAAGAAVNLRAQQQKAAEQAIAQGDPNVAGQLLASHAVTIPDLKSRQVTSQFLASAIQAAQKIDPNFKAPEAEAQARVAGSQENQQFFGNVGSLISPGGTLAQLQTAAQALPAGKFPAFNSVAQLASRATGNDPTARYAAAALAVADDYAKVIGGGVGTDASRQQVFDAIKASQSPEQLRAAIEQFRQGVISQGTARLGSNPYLNDMYGDAFKKQAGAQESPTAGAGQPVTVNGKLVGHSFDGGKTMIPVGGGQ